VKLVCPVDEFNASRHGDDSPAELLPPLFRRWTASHDAHPHEALFGILALLHGASSHEVRHLCVIVIDSCARRTR
jgi:hypothetical protein